MTERTQLEELFWEDLLGYIEDRSVIPIVGAELLTIDTGGKSAPLYREVAERLLAKYGLTGCTLRDNNELNDAVCMLDAAGHPAWDLYRPINEILQKLVGEQKEPLQPHRQLASIRQFDLFATTTPDDLLAKAIDTVRFGGARDTDQIEYAPKLPTGRQRDIPATGPEQTTSNYTAVFYLFGKTDVFPFYAIHDEDALEFPYTLQEQELGTPTRIFSALRNRNLLLIGCTFADWLIRFFLRLSNSVRLSSNQRFKKEFLVGDESTKDRNLIIFLERFSRNSRCYPGDARAFVAELYRRWSARNPSTGSAREWNLQVAAQEKRGTVFISYSRDDVDAAKRLHSSLMEIGGDVAWWDKTDLKPGDPWEQEIRRAIQRCTLFLPLISANTEKRTEAFFRAEWNDAADRSRKIQGRKFIFPIVIDSDYTGDMDKYELVPQRFKEFNYNHAPGGQMADDLKEEIKDQLRVLRRIRAG